MEKLNKFVKERETKVAHYKQLVNEVIKFAHEKDSNIIYASSTFLPIVMLSGKFKSVGWIPEYGAYFKGILDNNIAVILTPDLQDVIQVGDSEIKIVFEEIKENK